jgi:hypothetical protein
MINQTSAAQIVSTTASTAAARKIKNFAESMKIKIKNKPLR